MLPGEANLGLLVLLGGLVDGAANDAANGVVASCEVGIGTLVVRVLDVLSYVFPREKGAQARYLGLIVSYLEYEVIDAD